MSFLILNIERINKTNAAVIIDGPDAELNCSDEYKPKTTAKSPPIIEIIIICFGLLAKFLAIAAGIMSIPVININNKACGNKYLIISNNDFPLEKIA